MSPDERSMKGIKMNPINAIKELNERFRRAGVGYKFSNGQIIRIDSELIHTNFVQPALSLLSEKEFEGPNSEILQAYSHYRNGDYNEAIQLASNAFESTMKIVCDQRGLNYKTNPRASDLLKLLRKELLPNYLENSFDQLASTLSSGLPKVRNEVSAHGKGSDPQTTPIYVAAYTLHLAAVNILFLVEAHNSTKDVVQ